jgi:hypothetical protein
MRRAAPVAEGVPLCLVCRTKIADRTAVGMLATVGCAASDSSDSAAQLMRYAARLATSEICK